MEQHTRCIDDPVGALQYEALGLVPRIGHRVRRTAAEDGGAGLVDGSPSDLGEEARGQGVMVGSSELLTETSGEDVDRGKIAQFHGFRDYRSL